MIRRASVRQYERILIKCKVQLITTSFTVNSVSFDPMITSKIPQTRREHHLKAIISHAAGNYI